MSTSAWALLCLYLVLVLLAAWPLGRWMAALLEGRLRSPTCGHLTLAEAHHSLGRLALHLANNPREGINDERHFIGAQLPVC
jgi:hypothetical protein